MPAELWITIVGLYATLSTVTLAVFGLDKRAAKRNTWRTPEKTLLSLSLVGGWPGALLGMRLFRHKTRKARFRIGIPLIAGLHLAAWIVLGFTIVNEAISN